MQYIKAKDASKLVLNKGPKLAERTLATAKLVADVVGATLGPGGCPVLIERQEVNLPALVTKDGVTVFRSLGFDNPVDQEIMAAMRDAAVRTVSEAGDGTTTATILAEAILRYTNEYCTKNPRISPQRVVQRLRQLFELTIKPIIISSSRKADFTSEIGRRLLWSVAKISANGDEPLANAVIECFDKVGDDGNVTIVEQVGVSGYRVEKLEGYPIHQGYEVSCGRFASLFINDEGGQRCYLEKTVFVLYNGKLHDISSVALLFNKIASAWQNDGYVHNVVILANEFSETFIGELAFNFKQPTTIKVFPLQVPRNAYENSQLKLLEDIAALTGGKVFDPITAPLDVAELSELGRPVQYFECSRYRANIVGHNAELEVLDRVSDLKQQRISASLMEQTWIDERIGKLTGGIAKLIVVGSSNGELRERRDRAEDAIMAVRGALRFGCVPGGGWMLWKIIDVLERHLQNDEVVMQVLTPALREPILRLYHNSGYAQEEISDILNKMRLPMVEGVPITYDLLEGKFVDCYAGGLLDSVPAVMEALRNSISIASLLGTLGGIVVFRRNAEIDTQEASDSRDFERNVGWNPADERG